MGSGSRNGGDEEILKSLGSVGLGCIREIFAAQIFYKQNNFSSFVCLLNNFAKEAKETTQLMSVNISLKIRAKSRHKQRVQMDLLEMMQYNLVLVHRFGNLVKATSCGT